MLLVEHHIKFQTQ